MKGVGIVPLLAFLIPSVVLAQEIGAGDRGKVTKPFSVLVQSGVTISNADRIFRPAVDHCDTREGGTIHVGPALSTNPDTFIIHYDVKAGEKSQGEDCPRTVFFARLPELRALPIEWVKAKRY
jgi:hypothetical protein